jgi:hypothetical protein
LAGEESSMTYEFEVCLDTLEDEADAFGSDEIDPSLLLTLLDGLGEADKVIDTRRFSEAVIHGIVDVA